MYKRQLDEKEVQQILPTDKRVCSEKSPDQIDFISGDHIVSSSLADCEIKTDAKPIDEIQTTPSNPSTGQKKLYADLKVCESHVAITEFVTQGAQKFRGELKQRYEDFIVHELDSQGQLVKLNNLDLPTETTSDKKNDSELDQDDLLSVEIRNKLELLNADQTKEVTAEQQQFKPLSTIEIDVSTYNKEDRTRLHQYLKRFSSLRCLTKDIECRKVIVVDRQSSSSGRQQTRWPKDRPSFLHFTLYQENKGTFECVITLAKCLHISAKSLAYAGTKDKRSISSQRVSVYKVNAERLLRLNKGFVARAPRLCTGNFLYKSEPLRLGQSSGNRFELVLRDLEFKQESDIQVRMNVLKQNGFINYFGTQRFGMRSSPTQLVGARLLRKEYEKAVNLILSERENDIKGKGRSNKSFNECIRKYYETGDAKQVYQEFQWKYQPEGYLLKALSNQPKDFHGAMFQLPRNSRLLYLHAYQSYVWNRMASFRYRRYGNKLVVGDLVSVKEEAKLDQIVEAQIAEDDIKSKNQDLNKLLDTEVETEDVLELEELSAKAQIKSVTEDLLEQYSIQDLVLPMPGADIKYPENDVLEELKRILQEEQLDLQTFAKTTKADGLYGAYRHVIVKPNVINYELVKYQDEKQPLFKNDLDIVNGVDLDTEAVNGESNLNLKHALKVVFELPSSSYATVCVRELMQNDLVGIA